MIIPEELKNRKIWMGDNEVLSKKVQELLFELGFEWIGGGKEVVEKITEIFTNDRLMNYSSSFKDYTYITHPATELTPEELFSKYAQKKYCRFKTLEEFKEEFKIEDNNKFFTDNVPFVKSMQYLCGLEWDWNDIDSNFDCYPEKNIGFNCRFYITKEMLTDKPLPPTKRVSPELEKWLEKTKSENLSLEQLAKKIDYSPNTDWDIYKQLEGIDPEEKAKILFNKWQEEESSAKLKEYMKRYSSDIVSSNIANTLINNHQKRSVVEYNGHPIWIRDATHSFDLPKPIKHSHVESLYLFGVKPQIVDGFEVNSILYTPPKRIQWED